MAGHKNAKEVGITLTEIRVKGQPVLVPSAEIDGRVVIRAGRLLKIAALLDEDQLEGETIPDPQRFMEQLKRVMPDADIFTFGQKLPDLKPRHSYHLEWESLAVMPITTYSEWLQERVKPDVRSAVKKSSRLGLITKRVDLDDRMLEGIVKIYGESPIRQGKPFWHYKKDFASVKEMTSTYLDRSIFIGAYFNDELVGFIKMVTVNGAAYTFHVISMMSHFDKKPTNALIAKAVEICSQIGVSHLVYGNFVYKDPQSSLTEFKRRNGFQEVLAPRYYVPLTHIGQVALKANLHHGVAGIVPQTVWKGLRKGRALLSELWRTRAS